MEYSELIQNRYSARSFTTEPIADQDLQQILEAGRFAPTACNNQPQRILAVSSPEGMALLRKCTECHFNAPAALIVCYDKTACWKRPFDGHNSGDIDASIVTTHMMLEAADLGIGTTWVMYFIPEAVKTEFDLPDSWEPTAILVMGHPSEKCAPSGMHFSRKELRETVQFI